MKRIAILFGLAVVLAGCEDEEQARLVQLCYLPFGAETYAAVTIETICRTATENKIKIRFARRILKIAVAAPTGRFSKSLVRLKLTMSENRIVYIDNDGGVLLGNDERKVSDQDFLVIKNIIESNLREAHPILEMLRG